MKKLISILTVLIYLSSCCVLSGIPTVTAEGKTFTLYPSDNAGIIDPNTGVINTNGTVTGAHTALVGGTTLNGSNGAATISIPTANTLDASGTAPCWGKPAIKLKGNFLNAAVTYTPTAGSLNGVNTTVTYNGIASNDIDSAQLSALVRYNGGQTETVVVYAEGASAGYSVGTLLPAKVIGTYPNLESVKIYYSTYKGGDAYIYSVKFETDSIPVPTPTPTPTPAPTIELFTLYPSNNEGIVDPNTGVINTNGKVTGTHTALVGGTSLNGSNGVATIAIPTANTLDASGTAPCWGKPAIKLKGNFLNAAVTYTPTAGSLNGVNTTVTYNGIASNDIDSAQISALVRYNGGQTETVVVYAEGASAGYSVGTLLPAKVIGTYPNLESVKIYYSTYKGGDAYIYSVKFESGSTPTPTPVVTPTPTPVVTPTPVPTPTPGNYPYFRYDTMDNAAVMLSKSSNISFYSESVKTDSRRDDPYVSHMARRDSSSAEGYITYQIDNNPLSTIKVEAYYYDNMGYAGTSGSASGLERLNAVLQYEGVRFYQSTDNSTYTQIPSGNVALTKEVSPWPGITVHHVTYQISNIPATSKYFKIVYPQLQGASPLYNWSTRVDFVEFAYSSGGSYTGGYEWVNPANYPVNRISVVQPGYTANISGNTEIVICAPGFSQVTAKCWKQGSGFGTNQTVATVNLNSNGVGGFTFPANQYPKGPVTIVIRGTAGTLVDECNLQLYNTSGVSWNEGLGSAPVPPQISGLGLSVVYQDDFTNSDLSIHWNDSNKKYSSHKPGWGDFSGIAFRDYDYVHPPFSQVDTYMRIRADQPLNSTGLISSVHQNRRGFAVKAPAYFECKFIAPNAKGTWPAFWTLTNNVPQYSQYSNGECDELDVIEGYGFDSTQPQFANNNGYESVFHAWEQTPRLEQGSHVNMKNIGGQGMWYEGFHTYGVLITTTDTVYYCDNIEVWRHATLPVSKVDYHYFLINLAVGGASGWPYDLTRYNGKADMYVDWVRVYGLQQNVQVNQ